MTKKELFKNTNQIWHLLSEKKVLTIKKIEEITQTRESIVFIALGCLMHEDKIQLSEKGGVLQVELNTPMPETYY